MIDCLTKVHMHIKCEFANTNELLEKLARIETCSISRQQFQLHCAVSTTARITNFAHLSHIWPLHIFTFTVYWHVCQPAVVEWSHIDVGYVYTGLDRTGTVPNRTGLAFVCMEPLKIDPGQVYTEPFCNRSGTDPTMDLQTRQVQFWIHSRLVPERFRVNRRQSGQIFAPGPSGASPVQTQPAQ